MHLCIFIRALYETQKTSSLFIINLTIFVLIRLKWLEISGILIFWLWVLALLGLTSGARLTFLVAVAAILFAFFHLNIIKVHRLNSLLSFNMIFCFLFAFLELSPSSQIIIFKIQQLILLVNGLFLRWLLLLIFGICVRYSFYEFVLFIFINHFLIYIGLEF